MSPWIEKYRPKSFEEIKGQSNTIWKIKSFLRSFPEKKAILLHGPPGTGKTTLAYSTAKEFSSELFELNASDFRDKKRLQEKLSPAIKQKSLVEKQKIILIDEVDGIFGVDRGGAQELSKLIEESPYPIILTANDAYNKKLKSIRKQALLMQLNEIDYRTIKEVLIDVLRKEKKFVNNNILTKIAAKARGDLRAALNDLQTISKLKDPSSIDFEERNKESNIFNALKRVFQGEANKKILKIYDSVNMSLDEIILWVEKNIPKEYQGKELEKAYEMISKADVFRGRIYKQQYWRFLVYENIFLSYGIASIKEKPKTGFTNYQKPTRILKIWMNNQKTFKKKSISEKYAEKCHISRKRAMNEFPLIKKIINSNPNIATELKLTEEEKDYLLE
jgi:replication factor C large subunit